MSANNAAIASMHDGRALACIAGDLEHEVTWLARHVHELHGDDGGADHDVAGLRRAVIALASIAFDVSQLRCDACTRRLSVENERAPESGTVSETDRGALARALSRLAVIDNALRTDDDTGADLTIDVATREGLLIVLGEACEDVSNTLDALDGASSSSNASCADAAAEE